MSPCGGIQVESSCPAVATSLARGVVECLGDLFKGAEASADAVASGPAGQRSNEDGGETARVPSERRGPAAGRVLLANLFGDLWGVKLSAPSLLRTQWGFTTLPPDEVKYHNS